MAHDVFISHSHRDKVLADAVCARLESHGIRCWIAPRDVPPGADWAGSIVDAIGSARVFVLIFSGAVLQSEQVKREITLAANQQLVMMPLRKENIAPTGPFAYYLSNRHWLDVIDGALDEHLVSLAQTIDRLLGKPASAPDNPHRPQFDRPVSKPVQPKPTNDKLTSSSDRLWHVSASTSNSSFSASRISNLPPGIGLDADGLPDIVWCKVPAGEFLYGNPAKRRTLPDFCIAKYPITDVQFQAFIDAPEGYSNTKWWEGLHDKGKDQQRLGPGEPRYVFGKRPRITVSWYDAMAFCRWLASNRQMPIRLPTEQQWEKAARGTDGRAYPYGNEFDSTKGNAAGGGTTDVNAFPLGVSPSGALDMVGNVWEWTLTDYDNPDSSSLGTDSRRVLRGGSTCHDRNGAPPAIRVLGFPISRGSFIGFRLAATAVDL